MKDLDFDELDRAVNSLMTNVPKTPEPKKEEDDDHVQTLTITPTIKQDSSLSFNTLGSTLNQINKTDVSEASSLSSTPIQQPIQDKAESPATPLAATEQTPVPTTSPTSPVAARRGRFMDVVRPAGAVKKPDTSVSTSRLGATITPSGPSMKDVVPVAKPVTAASAVASPVPAPSPSSSDSDSNDWPDPLDIADKKTAATDTPTLVEVPRSEQDEDVPPTVPDKVETVEPKTPPITETPPAPLTSPFLADAKVEKRPLGMATTDDISVAATKEDAHEENDKKTDLQTNPVLEAPRPILPEELSTDMAALEAGADTVGTSLSSDSTSSTPTTPEPVKSTAPSTFVEPSEPIVTRSTMTTPEPDTKSASSGPASIPQQYHEEPSTGDQGNGSIYDTDTYHKPLAHPAKKSLGWMWVLWVVVILLLGAGGGAVLYFLHIF